MMNWLLRSGWGRFRKCVISLNRSLRNYSLSLNVWRSIWHHCHRGHHQGLIWATCLWRQLRRRKSQIQFQCNHYSTILHKYQQFQHLPNVIEVTPIKLSHTSRTTLNTNNSKITTYNGSKLVTTTTWSSPNKSTLNSYIVVQVLQRRLSVSW